MKSSPLGEYLSKNGISYSDMARRLGVDGSTVLRWATLERLPGVKWANAIEQATGGKVPARAWGGEPLPETAPFKSRRHRAA